MTAIEMIIEKALTLAEVKEAILSVVEIALKPEIKPDALYTMPQAAKLTEVSYHTIYFATRSGNLAVEPVGSEPRIRGRAINEWLKAGGKTGRSKRNLIEEKASVKRKTARA